MRRSSLAASGLLCAAVLLLPGCNTSQRVESYSSASATEFDKGRDRPPTARTLYSMAKVFEEGKTKDLAKNFMVKREFHTLLMIVAPLVPPKLAQVGDVCLLSCQSSVSVHSM